MEKSGWNNTPRYLGCMRETGTLLFIFYSCSYDVSQAREANAVYNLEDVVFCLLLRFLLKMKMTTLAHLAQETSVWLWPIMEEN